MSLAGNIVGVGMSSPLGLDAQQSAFMLRARKLAPTRTAFRDRRGAPMGDVRARRLDDGVVGRMRLLALAAPALMEATRALPTPRTLLPLFLALPARRAEAEEPLGPTFFEELGKRAGVPLALDQSEPFALGHAGFAVALARALDVVAARAAPFAVVGGVDSHHHPAVLGALDAERRLHAEGAWNGFVPSEAAAFVVVGPADTRGPLPPLAQVAAVATGMEPDPIPQDTTPGEVATEVVRTAATALPAPLLWVLPDVNGERHRVKEWTFVRIRNRDHFADDRTVETRLYDELGDVGAASGAVHAVYVTMALTAGFAPARAALIALASEGPLRGAVALSEA